MKNRRERLLLLAMATVLICAAVVGGICLLLLCKVLTPTIGVVVVNAAGLLGLMASCIFGSVLD